MRKLGVEPHVTATEAPWQNGLVERHGQVLAEIVSVMVDQCQLTGDADMRLAANVAAGAKNRRPDTTGHSARERVFGVRERFPGSVVNALQDGENKTGRYGTGTGAVPPLGRFLMTGYPCV